MGISIHFYILKKFSKTDTIIRLFVYLHSMYVHNIVIHGNTAVSENITAFNLDFQDNYDLRNSASWKSSNLKLFCKENDENNIPLGIQTYLSWIQRMIPDMNCCVDGYVLMILSFWSEVWLRRC